MLVFIVLMKYRQPLAYFEEGTIEIAINLESNNVGIVLMDDRLTVQDGCSVKVTRRIAQIQISEAYLLKCSS